MTNLNELNLIQVRNGLKQGDFTSSELVKACINQIDKFDSKIKAFITVDKDNALLRAKEVDDLIHEHGKKAFEQKPLLGIPFACKDNFCTRGLETTAGSNILKGFKPPYESTVTKRLKEAGAILIGKTNMDAFAHGASTETSDFFTTKNPWDITRVPGGSSGGSAASVAAHMCIFAIGSETGGSIRCPASWSGVTGFKPTYGRVPRYGLIAMASSTDSPGPLTKTAMDAAAVLQVIAGKDPLDATSSPVEVPNYIKRAGEVSLEGLKVGKPTAYFTKDIDKDVLDTVETCVEKLKSMGAAIIEIKEEVGAEVKDIRLLHPKYALAVYTILQRSEVSSNLARFDGIRYGHPRTHFGFEARKRMMLGAYALSAGYYDQYYAKAQKVRTELVKDFEKAFTKVDIIIGPNMPSTAMKVGASDTSPLFGELVDRLHLASALAGITAIVVPCGFSKNLPIGVQFLGPRFAEEKVLGVANRYQEITDYHKRFPDLTKL